MRVLLVGSGAREHALAWRLSGSAGLTKLHAAPGNPGIAGLGHCHPVRADDGEGLLMLAQTVSADLVVIGARQDITLAERLLGTVATEVVRRAQCEVLVVRPRSPAKDPSVSERETADTI